MMHAHGRPDFRSRVEISLGADNCDLAWTRGAPEIMEHRPTMLMEPSTSTRRSTA
jgi:hypothetical protein